MLLTAWWRTLRTRLASSRPARFPDSHTMRHIHQPATTRTHGQHNSPVSPTQATPLPAPRTSATWPELEWPHPHMMTKGCPPGHARSEGNGERECAAVYHPGRAGGITTRSAADPGQGGATLRDIACDASRAQALGDLLRLVEHGLCAVAILGAAAGDQRAGPRGARAGKKQRRAEPPLDLGGGGEVLLGLLVALQGRREQSEHPCDRTPHGGDVGGDLSGEGRQQFV